MKKSKGLIRAALVACLLASLSVDGQASAETEIESTLLAYADYGAYAWDEFYRDPSMQGYSVSSPAYPYGYENRDNNNSRQLQGDTAGYYYYDESGRRFGNMNAYNGYYNTSYNVGNYTSGVSSYPGTSTGPGIDNGYHATPSGIYNTINPVTGSYHR